MLLLAIFLVFFFSSISELPRSLDLRARPRSHISPNGGEGNRTGSSRKKPLRRPREGRKSSWTVVSVPLHGYTAKSKDVFFQFFFGHLPPPEEILPLPLERRGSPVKNPRFVREKDTRDCIEDLLSYSRISRPIQHPFNRDRISLKISLYLHTSSPT